MTTTSYTAEQVSAAVDSEVSSPRSDHLLVDNNRVHHDTTTQARVRFMCSFGGKILPRPHDNQLRYVGGDTRIVSVLRHNTTFSSLLNKLSKLSGKLTFLCPVNKQANLPSIISLVTKLLVGYHIKK
ncbi:hypothetical protein HanHA300_Chr15g0569741 [Helianthus annuus]|nr:hypothetical protein HanHA300_Chr15g0569741 [Helianthus annuus]KAJ0649094.1 hypothetical protein HanLR1_Chr15g0580301 [Helianthus annuus]